MDVSHPSFSIHNPASRHTQTQLQPQAPSRTHAQIQIIQHENPPPPKRRRANSGNPSDFSIVAHTTLPASTDWHQSRHSYPSAHIENTIEPSVAQNITPDPISRVSAVATVPLNGPQLRKKPKSSSIKNTTTIRAESPNHPSFHSPAQTGNETAQYIGTPNGYPVSSIYRANSGSSQHLSPTQKRPPASHSSYGVETTCGPPPSYSTQRTLSQERIRKIDRNSQTRGQASSSDPVPVTTPEEIPDASTYKKESTTFVIHSSPETADSQSVSTPTDTDGMSGVKIQGEQRMSMDEDTKMSSSDERKSEDLFLNIARVDAARHSQPKTDRRRSRMSIPFLPSSRSTQSIKPSAIQSQADIDPVPTARVEVSRPHSKRASFGGQTSNTYYPRNPMLEGGRFREHSVESTSNSERNDSRSHEPGLRRLSITNTEPIKLTHHSSTGLRQNGMASESANLDQMKSRENIATESTVSTAAPSTVWDELDDLKSRIRKLELTGKLPPSSAAAMSSAERPRTATTAATTMSTSPKYKPSDINVQPTEESVSSNVHPLLHEALNNARAVISHDVYQRLQATAQDALQLAAMIHHEDINSRSYATPLSNDRQLKRRAESMCRSLTELAIALAGEGKPGQNPNRPGSREHSLPPNSMLRGRRYSNDPADRSHVSGRVQSRIESRRTSVHLRQGGSGNLSPENMSYQSPASNPQLSDPRIHRSSTLLRKRAQGSFDGTVDSFEASPSIRPGSRAVTDIGTYRRPTIDPVQSSREYTSQYPLPHQQDVHSNSNYGAAFAARRKHTSPASGVVSLQDGNPVTPREAWGRMSMTPADTQSPDVVSDVGGSGRLGFSRRSIGFTSRVGSNVGSRLRAVRAERSSRENMDTRGNTDMAPLSYDNHSNSVVDLGLHHPSNG